MNVGNIIYKIKTILLRKIVSNILFFINIENFKILSIFNKSLPIPFDEKNILNDKINTEWKHDMQPSKSDMHESKSDMQLPKSDMHEHLVTPCG